MRFCGPVRAGLIAAFFTTAWLGLEVGSSLAQARSPAAASDTANVPLRKESVQTKDPRQSETAYTVGLVTGAPHSTEFSIAQDIATTLASGQETGPHGEMALRVLPIVGNGGTGNIRDVLTLAGADMAVAPVLLVDRLRDTGALGDIRSKLVYIAPLYVEEFHLLARAEIKSLTDLDGKTVNLGERGSAGATLGLEVLNSLGVKVTEVNLGLDAALDGMHKGQISATLMVSGKPVEYLAHSTQAEGLHFLPIPYAPALQHDYLPSTLRHDDYPNIIGANDKVNTIATKSALFAYNWPMRSDRYRLMELFVQSLFSRFPEFRNAPHHPKWRQVNLAAELPGWQRFRPAERWLQRQSDGEAALRNAFARFLQDRSIKDPADREELFEEFMRWQQRHQQK